MKKTKSLVMAFALATVAIGLGSCNGNNKNAQLQSQLDSLATADSLHQEDIKAMTDFVDIMSSGLDSINGQEGQIKQLGQEQGGKLDKAHLRQQLNNLAQLVARQRNRINELEKSLQGQNTSYAQRVKKLIAYYKAQLDEKDKTIAELKTELDSKNADIATLNEHVDKLTTNVNDLTASNNQLGQTVASQKTTIAEQDQAIHEAFVTVGTSKDLKARGLLTGGFLAKKRVDVSKLSSTGFTKVDIRNYNDFVLKSKKPKIMTQMPSDSYTLRDNGNGTTTLHINDANRFWSVSKYLVVKL